MIIPRLNFSKLKSHQRIATPRTGSNESWPGFVPCNGVSVTAARSDKNNVTSATSSRSHVSKSSSNYETGKNDCTTSTSLSSRIVNNCAKETTVANFSSELLANKIAKDSDSITEPNSCRTIDDFTVMTTTTRSMNNAENITPDKVSWLRRSHALKEMVGFDISTCHDVEVLQFKLIEVYEKNAELENYYEVELQERVNYFAHRLRALTEYQLAQDALNIPTTVAVNTKKPKAVSSDMEKETINTPRYDMARATHVDMSNESKKYYKINVRTPRSSTSKLSTNVLNITREVEDAICSVSRKNINHMYSTMNSNTNRNNYNEISKTDSNIKDSVKKINNDDNNINNNTNEVHFTHKNRRSNTSTPFLTPASHSRSVHPFTLSQEFESTQVQPMTTAPDRALYATPSTMVMTRTVAAPNNTLLFTSQQSKANCSQLQQEQEKPLSNMSHDRSSEPHYHEQQQQPQHKRRDQQYVRAEIKLGDVGASASKTSKEIQHKWGKALFDSNNNNAVNKEDNNIDNIIDTKKNYKKNENKSYDKRNNVKANMITFPRSTHVVGKINEMEEMKRTEPLELLLEDKAHLITPRPRRSYSAQVSDYSRHLYDLAENNNANSSDIYHYRNHDKQMSKHAYYLRSGNRRRLRCSQTRSRVSYSKSSNSAVTVDTAATTTTTGNSLQKVQMAFSEHQQDSNNNKESEISEECQQKQQQQHLEQVKQKRLHEQIEQRRNCISRNSNNNSNTETEVNELTNRPNPNQCIVKMLNTSRQEYATSDNNIMSAESTNTQSTYPPQNANFEQVRPEEAKEEMRQKITVNNKRETNIKHTAYYLPKTIHDSTQSNDEILQESKDNMNNTSEFNLTSN